MFNILLHKDVVKFLKFLDKELQDRIKKKLRVLETDPYPAGCIKLAGTRNMFRLRVGNYRVLYYVDYDSSTIVIDKIDKRSSVYN
ncbi:MAG: type II toxin-antitoxin system RelE/ParE family toxin [Candidatus Aenigmarchaeota archaeon]|nr:type II toxin-antitoxin system RelE/ParE family toxin [Candidatus Aenigmarchaeota archaeon]